MKRKYLDRGGWPRVRRKRYVECRSSWGEKQGTIGLLCIDEVTEPKYVSGHFGTAVLCDVGVNWLEFLPDDKSFCLTAIYAPDGEVGQLYFDMIADSGRDGDGRAWFDDAYLDYVVTGDRRCVVKDEDELEEALRAGDITTADYDGAYASLERLKVLLSARLDSLIAFCDTKRLELREII